MRAQNKARAEEIEAKCVAMWCQGMTPEPSVLKHLVFLPQEDFDNILSKHPCYSIDDAIKQVGSAFKILTSAHNQILETFGRYYSNVAFGDLSSNLDVAERATSQVFQFSFAAAALIQTYRRLLSVCPDRKDEFTQLVNRSIADECLAGFVQELRNNFGHVRIHSPSPRGTYEIGGQRNASVSILFKSSDLLEGGQWNLKAKSYIERQDEIDIISVIHEYHGFASKIFISYLARIGLLFDVGLGELRKIRAMRRHTLMTSYLNAILPAVSGGDFDPYCHLDKIFCNEELERILSLPCRSRQQVDYMIMLRDPLGLCEQNFREDLYRLFGAE